MMRKNRLYLRLLLAEKPLQFEVEELTTAIRRRKSRIRYRAAAANEAFYRPDVNL